MTEKTLKAIELGVDATLSIGVNYVVNKVIEKAVDPQTIPEKIIMMAGAAGVDLAIDYGITKMVHSILYPSEVEQYKSLVAGYEEAVKFDCEVAKKMAEMECRIENKVDEVYNQIMKGAV